MPGTRTARSGIAGGPRRAIGDDDQLRLALDPFERRLELREAALQEPLLPVCDNDGGQTHEDS